MKFFKLTVTSKFHLLRLFVERIVEVELFLTNLMAKHVPTFCGEREQMGDIYGEDPTVPS